VLGGRRIERDDRRTKEDAKFNKNVKLKNECKDKSEKEIKWYLVK